MTAKHVSAPSTPGLQAVGDTGRQQPLGMAEPESAPDVPQHAPARIATVDYYAIISKTVVGLALNNPETRGEVYDHAREVVSQRLTGSGGSMSSHMIAIEQIAFDRAIKRIESEQRARDATRPRAPQVHGTTSTSPESSPDLSDASTSTELAAAPIAALGSAPAIVAPKRPMAMPEVKHLNGGSLRLFAVVALIVIGVGGYWIAAGKPNLMDARGPQRTATITPPEIAPSNSTDNERSAAEKDATREAVAAQTVPSEPSDASAAVQLDADSPDAVAFAQRENDLATFLLLCRPAMKEVGEVACGNLEPRPFGGAAAAARNAPEWVSMYSDLADTIPAKRVAKPVFSAATPPPQAGTAPLAGDPAARPGNSAAREKFERGLALAKADNLDGAVASFSDAVKLDPKFAEAYFQRGQVMFKNGNAERAVADFTLAIQLDPRNAQAFKARGMATLYKGDDDGAIVDLTKAIQYAEIDPNSIPPVEVFYARRSRAGLYDRKQLYDRELVDLSAMIDGFWRNPALATALKTTYREQGANSLMASIYRLRGVLYQKLNNIDGAVGDLSFAIQLEPQRSLQYIIERGRILEVAGKRDQAIADYKQALELSPANTDVKNALARLTGKT